MSKTKTVGGTPSTTYAAFNSDSQLCWTGPTSGTCASPPGGSATNYVYDHDGNQTTSPTNVSTYNGTDQTITIAHGGGAAGGYGYTGTSQDQRVAAPGINYRNGLLGVQSEIAGGVFSYYERDPAGNLITMIKGGTGYSYAYDGYGNVRYLVDNTGTVQTGYTFDPYGDNGTESGPNYALGDSNHYRYRGEYFDDATNQYKIGKRYYDPISGTWTQQDSINVVGDPARGNHYSYTDGDPVNNVDPSGNDYYLHVDAPFGAGLGTGGYLLGRLSDAVDGLVPHLAYGVIGLFSSQIAQEGKDLVDCVAKSVFFGCDVTIITFKVFGYDTGVPNGRFFYSPSTFDDFYKRFLE